MKDKYKLGLVYILETVLRCKHHKININVFCLDVVDDVEVFNVYLWGQRCFLETVHAFKRIHTMKGSKSDRKYYVYGFLLAVQATDIPIAKDVAAIFDDPQVRPYHHTDVFSKIASDRVLVESNMVREQEVDKEMETRYQPEVDIGVRMNMETEIETGQPDVEI
ncbi:Uncharacterized protein Adt_15132 [Abeliophyllum distichum]|uniref:DUF1985 domain-containing protein n=1 Tax=Abeliophyllum distichum TaxID=126358 RepID=A0ABD1U2Q3_9LAMI